MSKFSYVDYTNDNWPILHYVEDFEFSNVVLGKSIFNFCTRTFPNSDCLALEMCEHCSDPPERFRSDNE